MARASGSGFRSDVQGLRALAVVLVVLYHASVPGLTGGYIGVDIFFVLSGYLITGLLTRELYRDGRISLLEFYARRIRRLLPAALLVVLATTIAFAWVFSPIETKMLTSTSIATVVYSSNIWFAVLATDYLGGSGETNPLLHTWSLAVEEQFYLVWPFILLMVWRWSSRGTRARHLAFTIVILSLVSLAACVVLTRVVQPMAFFLAPARAWEFGAGALVAVVPIARSLNATGAAAIRWVGLALIMIPAFTFGANTAFPGYAALLPVAGTMLFLIESNHGTGVLDRMLNSAVAQRVGDASYSWYLWHWPVLILAEHVAGPSSVGTAVAVLASLLLALITLHLVENPIRFRSGLGIRTANSTFAGGAALSAVVLVGLGVVRFDAESASSSPEQVALKDAAGDMAEVYRDGCFSQYFDDAPRNCVYGPAESAHSIVLFGDSRAAQWFPAAKALAERSGAQLLPFLKAACPAPSVEPFDRSLKRAYTECTVWRTAALEAIAARRPKLVLVSSASDYLPHPDHPLDWRAGLERTLVRLTSSGATVVLLRDTPDPPFHVPTCLSRAIHHRRSPDEQCSFATAAATSETVWKVFEEVSSLYAGTKAVDLTPLICPGASCRTYDRDIVKFFDGSHLSATFVESISEEFAVLVTSDRVASASPSSR